ncbi:Transcriptional regulator, AsnC family [Pseudonocardia sp. Ae505_Ps2]|nr:Transcriptional regulator, AsnC family [Pseudonocardia sp. Ae505_Ps2]
MPETEVDELDHAILRLLHEDARRTYADMAARVGLSTAATKRRVDRLRESGVITGFTVQVDHAKLGWPVEAFSEIRYAGTASVSEIVDTASRQPEVQAVYTSPVTSTPWSRSGCAISRTCRRSSTGCGATAPSPGPGR